MKGVPQPTKKLIWFTIEEINENGKKKYVWKQYSKVNSLQVTSIPYTKKPQCLDNLVDFIHRIKSGEYEIKQ